MVSLSNLTKANKHTRNKAHIAFKVNFKQISFHIIKHSLLFMQAILSFLLTCFLGFQPASQTSHCHGNFGIRTAEFVLSKQHKNSDQLMQQCC